MKLLVAGSRGITDYKTVARAVSRAVLFFDPAIHDLKIIHGGADGVDTLAGRWAAKRGLETEVFLPDYDEHPGQLAPLYRNEEMVEEADAALFIWDGESSGTDYTIEEALYRSDIDLIVVKV